MPFARQRGGGAAPCDHRTLASGAPMDRNPVTMESNRPMMNRPIVRLGVQRIGYLVPTPSFDGTVQSVYARACNIASGRSLLTLVAPGIADGPTVLVLAGDRAIDLRTCFTAGD